jgi:CubicO group peptidase (beta-lactamase class C family)
MNHFLAITRTSALAVILSVIPAACVAQPAVDDPQLTRMQDRFDALEAEGFTGFVMISREGETAFFDAAGTSNPADNRPLTPDTLVDHGSITKTFTGLMAAQLMVEDRLSPDQTLADYFDNLPADKAALTIHQLLTHSSGLPDAVGDDVAVVSTAEFLELAFAAELMFEPGTSYEYSNVGFSLIALIIEQITGQDFETYLRETYLRPNGIENTGYMAVYDSERTAHTTDGVALIDASWGGHAPNRHIVGNGGMLTTANDSMRWLDLVRQGEFVSTEAVELARQPYVDEGSGHSFYGYGVVVENHPELGQIYWHNGGNPHFMSHWRDFADHGYVIYVFANQYAISADQAVDVMTGALFDFDVPIQAIDLANPEQENLPDSLAGHLAGDFLAAISSDDDAARRAFTNTQLSTSLSDAMSVERRAEFFGMLHDDFGSARFMGVTSTDAGLILHMELDGGAIVVGIELIIVAEAGEARLDNLGING